MSQLTKSVLQSMQNTSRYTDQTIFNLTRKIQQFLGSVKDTRDVLSLCDMYGMPCPCGEIYIDTTKCSTRTRIGEHICFCHLRQPEKSAVAKHALLNADHRVLFKETKILALVSAYISWLHIESVSIYKYGCLRMNQKGESLLLDRICHAMLPNQSHCS